MARVIKPEDIGFILLASGQSRRMGENKLLLPVGPLAVPCVRKVAEILTAIAPHRVFVVYYDEAVKQALTGLPLETVYNARATFGQSESIKLGITQLWPETIQAFAFVMGDQPLLDAECIEKLTAAFVSSDANIAVPCVGEQSFSPVIFHRCWTEALLQLEGDQGAKGLMASAHAVVCRVPFETAACFEDIDTPEAYQALQKRMTQITNGG